MPEIKSPFEPGYRRIAKNGVDVAAAAKLNFLGDAVTVETVDETSTSARRTDVTINAPTQADFDALSAQVTSLAASVASMTELIGTLSGQITTLQNLLSDGTGAINVNRITTRVIRAGSAVGNPDEPDLAIVANDWTTYDNTKNFVAFTSIVVEGDRFTRLAFFGGEPSERSATIISGSSPSLTDLNYALAGFGLYLSGP